MEGKEAAASVKRQTLSEKLMWALSEERMVLDRKKLAIEEFC